MAVSNSQSELSKADINTIRKKTQRIMKDDNITQGQLSDKSGIPGTRLSQFLNNKYPGNNAALATDLQKWINSYQEHKQQATTLPEAPGYYLTETTRKITDTLAYGHVAGDIVVIYGVAGAGKTKACLQYREDHPNVWVATMKPSCREVMPAVERIARVLGLRELPNSASKISQMIEDKLQDSGGLLIIDEAQNLHVSGLEEIRSWHDATGVGIALVGNETVHARLANKHQAAYLDRLSSRVGMKHKVSKVLKADIEALLKAWNITDLTVAKFIKEIAQKGGRLRSVTKVIQLANMYATGGNETLNASHIKAAYQKLGGIA